MRANKVGLFMPRWMVRLTRLTRRRPHHRFLGPVVAFLGRTRRDGSSSLACPPRTRVQHGPRRQHARGGHGEPVVSHLRRSEDERAGANEGEQSQVYDAQSGVYGGRARSVLVFVRVRDGDRCVGYAIGSVEGRIGVEYFDPSPEVQEKKYAFKCHRQAIDDVDHVWPVNALAFHPVFVSLSLDHACLDEKTGTIRLRLRGLMVRSLFGITRSRNVYVSTRNTRRRFRRSRSTAMGRVWRSA